MKTAPKQGRTQMDLSQSHVDAALMVLAVSQPGVERVQTGNGSLIENMALYGL